MRGRRLWVPRGRGIRPTSDRVREALFDLIGQDLRGLRVLDLFAGTGALGLEALSRGACRAVFVDRTAQALGAVRKNLEHCGVEHLAEVHRHDLRRGLPPGAAGGKAGVDLVFLDPPYGQGLAAPLLATLGRSTLLHRDALIIAETGARETLLFQEASLRLLERRSYGDTEIHMFRLGRGHGANTEQLSQLEKKR